MTSIHKLRETYSKSFKYTSTSAPPPVISSKLPEINSLVWVPSSATQLLYPIPEDLKVIIKDCKLGYLPCIVKSYDKDNKFGEYILEWEPKISFKSSVQSVLERSILHANTNLTNLTDNLCCLPLINNASLLWEFMLKYHNKKYQFNIGKSNTMVILYPLIATNMYKSLIEDIKLYRFDARLLNFSNYNIENQLIDHAHLYKFIRNTFNRLLIENSQYRHQQSLIFHGLNSSVKSEFFKISLQYLLYLSSSANQKVSIKSEVSRNQYLGGLSKNFLIPSSDFIIGKYCLVVSTIFDLFGNASTRKIDNFSRSIKSITLHYQIHQEIDTFKLSQNELNSRESNFFTFIGASCSFKLIDTSRSDLHNNTERIYHIFIAFLAYLNMNEREQTLYSFESPTLIRDYLDNWKLNDISPIESLSQEFSYFINLLVDMKVSNDAIFEIKNCLSACILLMSIHYTSIGNNVELDASSKSTLAKIANLLSLKQEEGSNRSVEQELEFFLLTKSIDKSETRCNIEDARNLQNGLFLEIYNRIIKFLIVTLSSSFQPLSNQESLHNTARSIHLVDPMGYESLPVDICSWNGLSQLFINFVYEKISLSYISSSLSSAMIPTSPISSVSQSTSDESQLNFQFVEFFEKPGSGLFHVFESINNRIHDGMMDINEEDRTLKDKIFEFHVKSRQVKSAGFREIKTAFYVHHSFNENYGYNCAGFLSVHRSKLTPNIINLLQRSSSLVLQYSGDVETLNSITSQQSMLAKSSTRTNCSPAKFCDYMKVLMNNINSSTDQSYILAIQPSELTLPSGSTSPVPSSMAMGTPKISTQRHSAFGNTSLPVNTPLQVNSAIIFPLSTSIPRFDPNFVLSQIKALSLSQLVNSMKEKYVFSQSYGEIFALFRPMLSLNDSSFPIALNGNENMQYIIDITKSLMTECFKLCDLSNDELSNIDDMVLYSQQYVHFKSMIIQRLTSARAIVIKVYSNATIVIQSTFRMISLRRKYKRIRNSFICLQMKIRNFLFYKKHCIQVKKINKIKFCFLRYWYSRLFQKKKKCRDIIVRFIKRVIHRRKFHEMMYAIVKMQEMAKGYLLFKRILLVLPKLSIVKRALRNYIRKLQWYTSIKDSVILVQKYLRGYFTRKQQFNVILYLHKKREERLVRRVITKLQGRYRRNTIYSIFCKLKYCCITIQAWIRCKLSHMRFNNMKIKVLQVQMYWRRKFQMKLENTRFIQKQLMLHQENRDKFIANEILSIQSICERSISISSNRSYPMLGTYYIDNKFKCNRHIVGVTYASDLSKNYPKGFLKVLLNFCQQDIQNVEEIVIADGHTIILDNSNQLYAFGTNFQGELGTNSRLQISYPMLLRSYIMEKERSYLKSMIPIKASIIRMCCGSSHSLVLTSSGRVYSWGANDKGQLGHSNFRSCSIPQLVGGDSAEGPSFSSGKPGGMVRKTGVNLLNTLVVKQIACGSFHSCCVTESGIFYIWGYHACLGSCGESLVDASEPITLEKFKKVKVQFICCGDAHTIIQTSSKIFSFGKGLYGQLGNGRFQDSISPCEILLPRINNKLNNSIPFDYIIKTGGRHNILLLKHTNEIYTWGWNSYGQCGINTLYNTKVHTPSLLKDDTFDNFTIKDIACGWTSTSILLSNGEIYMLGSHRIFGTTSEEYESISKPKKLPIDGIVQSINYIGSSTLSLLTVDLKETFQQKNELTSPKLKSMSNKSSTTPISLSDTILRDRVIKEKDEDIKDEVSEIEACQNSMSDYFDVNRFSNRKQLNTSTNKKPDIVNTISNRGISMPRNDRELLDRFYKASLQEDNDDSEESGLFSSIRNLRLDILKTHSKLDVSPKKMESSQSQNSAIIYRPEQSETNDVPIEEGFIRDIAFFIQDIKREEFQHLHIKP